MWGRPWMSLLLFGLFSGAVMFAIAGVNRLRLIPGQTRKADRVTSAVIGGAVIAGGLYVMIAIVRYVLSWPEWMS
jgi:hypothetical protein